MSLREWGECPRGLVGAVGTLANVAACREAISVAGTGNKVAIYSRDTGRLQRLKVEDSVSSLRLASTVDTMLAVGTKGGNVSVFQIPKPHPDNVPDFIKPKPAQIEKYNVGGLHRSEITSLEWSKNGMKLFSGDKDGIVVLTEIDFYMHICKSSEIINESYEIVQLSYFQNYLLVSSVYRCILCHWENSKWTVNQVGKKDRKNLCKLGGVFHFDYNKPNNLNIYSARPGLRLWTSDKEGNVLQTLLFKEAVMNPATCVPLLKPANKNAEFVNRDVNFGPLQIFNNEYIVSHNDDTLYILDPVTLVSIATVDNLRRIVSVSVTNDEIFVVDGEHNIVRISYHPDTLPKSMDEKLMTRSLFNPIELAINTIKDFTFKERKRDVETYENYMNIDIESPIAISTDCTSIVKADECFELPPVVDFSKTFGDSLIIEPKFNEQDICPDVDIVVGDNYTGNNVTACKVIKKCKRSNIINIPSKTELEKNKRMEGTNYKTTKSNIVEESYYTDNCLLVEDRSPESIEKDIRNKEEQLAKLLNIEPITKKPIIVESPPNTCNIDEEEIAAPIVTYNSTKPKSTRKNLINSNPAEKVTPIPECVNIPNLWNLKEIKVNVNDTSLKKKTQSANNSHNEVFDADWELI